MKEISVYDLRFNPFGLVAKDWALATAGDENKYNTLTIAWIEFGSLWNSLQGQQGFFGAPVISIFIRPQRYTRQFIDEQDYFTVSVYDENFKKQLMYLGSHSGRDEDKLKAVNMKASFINGIPYVDDAEIVFICKKLYRDPFEDNNFENEEINSRTYPQKDYSIQYIGEVEKVLISDNALKKFT